MIGDILYLLKINKIVNTSLSSWIACGLVPSSC